MKKRTLSILLALSLLLCLLPAAAFAEDMPVHKKCGSAAFVEKCEGEYSISFSDPEAGHYQAYMCNNEFKHGSYVGSQRFYSDTQLPHEFVNGVCKDCEYKCRHDNTSHVENGEYWFTCSKCNMVTEKKAFPDLLANSPDKVCRTQDYVFSFTLPEGCTDPGFSWGFTLKGDGGELTPVDGVCTVTVKSEWYDDDENSFTLEVGADIEGVHFTNSKPVTIVDGHEGGTATCIEKAVCDICNQPYGELDKDNHVGGTVLKGDKPATCTEDGYTGDTCCESCDAVFDEGIVLPAEGHLGGTATCVEMAVCEICNESYGELDKDNHVGGTELKGVKHATDTEDGYTGDTYCLGCGELLALGEVVPAEKPVAPSEKPADSTDAPKTGDSSNITLWFALLLFSGAAIVKTAKTSKKKEK